MASEERIRTAADEIELAHLIVNETRNLAHARQVFLLHRQSNGRHRVIAISSMALIDRDTPLVRAIENLIGALAKEPEFSTNIDFTLPAYCDPPDPELAAYPFSEMVWQPFTIAQASKSGDVFAGLLLARQQPWRPDDLKLLTRQAAVYTNAWSALNGRHALRPVSHRRGYWMTGIALALLCAGAIPVPMTTLAPVEIIADSPEIVTAPIDGVIKDIPVDPNRTVSAGTALIVYEDTTLKNRFALSDREMQVAAARYEKAEQAAVFDIKARHDLPIAKTEYELKKTERDYAQALLDKAVVTASSPGIAIYASREEWLGRPVTTGEKIMSIARPGEIVARIELAVGDAIALVGGANVRLFLDASPLDALAAKVTSESYHAAPNSANQLVYSVYASLTLPPPNPADREAVIRELPRIGARGTAQVFGATVPLAFFLFRRPIAFARQTLGF